MEFMSSVLKYKQNDLLVKTLPWVYKTYMAKGFKEDFFKIELENWIQALASKDDERLGPIIDIYDLMTEWHETNIEVSQMSDYIIFDCEAEWTDEMQDIMDALLEGESKSVFEKLLSKYKLPQDTETIYLGLFQPVLYRIGELWEEGKLSVGDEHLVSSAVTRLMAHLHMMTDRKLHMKGDVVIATGEHEHHQIGARMVADLMENNGWNVRFLGSDLPVDSFSDVLDHINPKFVALSVTMPFNITKVIETVKYIRSRDRWNHIKIMVGGLVINKTPSLQHIIGANAYPYDAAEAVAISNQWHNESDTDHISKKTDKEE
tara:strand:- start:131 stop:1084 length:954 start_codon:yes stop_codon:yes gene_type:complete